MADACTQLDDLGKAGNKAIGISTQAMRQFCEDISGMFGMAMDCADGVVQSLSNEELAAAYGQPAVLVSVKTNGVMDGEFGIVFDRAGLFTLAGVVVMLPEPKVLENRESGGLQEVEAMGDAIGEVGNLLVGSWDRMFREKMYGHGHFVQTGTLVGNPWQEEAESAGWMSAELVCIGWEMTIDPYPPFKCAVLIPRKIFAQSQDANVEVPKAPEVTAKAKPSGPTKPSRPKINIKSLAGAAKGITAADVMQRHILWVGEEETVGQIQAKMRDSGSRYVLVGKDGRASGIISLTDIEGALSPYLRPIFERWRRVQDNATLEIKAKWFMSQPVRCIQEKIPISAVAEEFLCSRGGCLPVKGDGGRIAGLITMLDIMRLLSEAEAVKEEAAELAASIA